LVLILVMQLAVLGSAAAQDRFVLSADAVPACITADGKSYSQIAITVTNVDGTPAPDGTVVQVSTTAGNVTTTAYAGGGRATAILTSTTSPEVAIVNCSAGGTSASTQVEFSSLPGGGTLGPKIIRMEGKSLAYSVDRDVVLASDGVYIEYNGLEVQASSAQISEPMGTIRAQGEVKIRSGDQELTADALAYDLRTDRCRLLTAGVVLTGPANSLFKSDKLRKSDASALGSNEFAPLTADSTKSWIIAKKLAVFPRDRIQFTHASLYLGNTRVVNVPYYVYDYNNRNALMDQIRYTQYEGFVADIPMYYRVTDSGSGALKLRYAQKGSDYGGYSHPRKGPSLGIEQTYSMGDRGEGRVFLDAVSDNGRSLELTHHHEFGTMWNKGRADLSLRYQPNASFAKGVYSAYVNASLSGGKYDYYLTGFVGGSKVPVWDPMDPANMEYTDRADSSVRATIRPKRGFSAGSISFSPNLSLGYGRVGVGTSLVTQDCAYQSTGLDLSVPAIGNRTMSLSFNGATELTATSDGRMGESFRVGTNLRRSWRGGSASLGYTLNLRSGPAVSMFSNSIHTINGNLYAGLGTRWNCNAYFGYGLDTGRLNLYSSAMYQIAPRWKLRADYSLYRYKYSSGTTQITSGMSYLKTGIYYPIGPYEVGLAWSPSGKDYWSNSSRKVWVEVGMAGF
jgi:hypothetical protein